MRPRVLTVGRCKGRQEPTVQTPPRCYWVYTCNETALAKVQLASRGDLGKDVEGEEKKEWEWKLIRTKNFG